MHRHPLDVLSLLSGAVFVLIGLSALSGASWFALRLDLWGPALVIVLGVALLASVRGTGGSGATAEGPSGGDGGRPGTGGPDDLDEH